MTALIDTHALLWWLSDPSHLSLRVRQWLEDCKANGNGQILLSSVTLWEIEDKRLRGKLHLQAPVSTWLEDLVEIPCFELIDTTAEIWLTTASLSWNHRDPADRIIAATALAHQVPVVTRDRKFHAADSPVKAIW